MQIRLFNMINTSCSISFVTSYTNSGQPVLNNKTIEVSVLDYILSTVSSSIPFNSGYFHLLIEVT